MHSSLTPAGGSKSPRVQCYSAALCFYSPAHLILPQLMWSQSTGHRTEATDWIFSFLLPSALLMWFIHLFYWSIKQNLMFKPVCTPTCWRSLVWSTCVLTNTASASSIWWLKACRLRRAVHFTSTMSWLIGTWLSAAICVLPYVLDIDTGGGRWWVLVDDQELFSWSRAHGCMTMRLIFSYVYCVFVVVWNIAPSFCPYSRYLSGGLPGESPPVATASAQSRERLAAVKQALRALGFNKQV